MEQVARESFRQRLMRFLYPVIMRTGKWLRPAPAVDSNEKGIRPNVPLYNLHIQLNNGNDLSLETFRGKKILLVNTASDCGYTAQYEGLQQLYERYANRLVVVGFPSNDFRDQERGTDAEIAQFCQVNYGVQFPLAKKSHVKKGTDQHPVFRWLTDPSLNGWCGSSPEWNFSKYLVSEDGVLLDYFATTVSPLDPMVTNAIEA